MGPLYTGRSLRIAVLVKQVPRSEELQLEDGRLVRDGVELEVNAYCRRANAKAVHLAAPEGEVVVFTMGPPAAEDALREMLACGATRAVHLCDRAFAGSDTLATARALAVAISREGPFDLVLAGLNSLDADTGQVGPEVAALLGMPFAPAVRDLDVDVDGPRFRARLETDDGFRSVDGPLPAVLSCAERLCDPSKAPPAARSAVDPSRIQRVSAADLDLRQHEVGEAGSPTTVGSVEVLRCDRRRERVGTAAEAVERLEAIGAFDTTARVPIVPVPDGRAGPRAVWCFIVDPAPAGMDLLGEAAALLAPLGGEVVAVVVGEPPPGLGAAGADRVLAIPAGTEPDQWADALAAATAASLPWALLVQGTRDGRAVASQVAGHRGWGLIGDAIGLTTDGDDRLVALKPAFGGALVAAVASDSPVQIATVRPGVVMARTPRPHRRIPVEWLLVAGPSTVRTVSVERTDTNPERLVAARRVVGVGTAVDPAEYPMIDRLRAALGGAELAATRKVTDRGWLPRSRQVGITGRAIAPDLYVAVGVSGKYNHMAGVSNARCVLAVNLDPDAPVFDFSDLGIVGDWRVVVPALTDELDLCLRSRSDAVPR